MASTGSALALIVLPPLGDFLPLEAKVTDKIFAHKLECMRFVMLFKHQPAWATMQWATMLATCRSFSDGIGQQVNQSKAASV